MISLGRLALPDSEVLVAPGRSTNHLSFNLLQYVMPPGPTNGGWNARFAKAVAGRLADLSDEVRKAALEACPCLKRYSGGGGGGGSGGGGGGNSNTSFIQYVYICV